MCVHKGAGGYADSKVGAVSTTGHGEAIIRTGLAHRITYLMEAGKGVKTKTMLMLLPE